VAEQLEIGARTAVRTLSRPHFVANDGNHAPRFAESVSRPDAVLAEATFNSKCISRDAMQRSPAPSVHLSRALPTLCAKWERSSAVPFPGQMAFASATGRGATTHR
jgi:hypothetical protein